MRLWGLGAVLAACLAVGPAASGDPLPFTISLRAATRLDSARRVAPIAPGFVGVSIDYCSIADYAGTSATPILVRLLLGLSPVAPVLRVGGDGPDATCPGDAPRPMSVVSRTVAALARAVRGRLILGVNLFAHNRDLVRREVKALLRAIDQRPPYPLIAAVELANEPDLSPSYGSSAAPQQTEAFFRRYLRDAIDWARVVRVTAKDPGLAIAGPSLGRPGLPWITGLNRRNLGVFQRSPVRPALVTFHSYPLLGQVPCPQPACASMPNLLLDRASHGLAQDLFPFLRRLRPGRYLRVDEMNSVTGGGASQVSDTFASALWALDTMFEFARAGVVGVNVHTFPSAFYALYSNPGRARWVVHPEYYGLLMFARAAPAGARLLDVGPVDLPALGGPNVKVWATRDRRGVVRIVLINKDTAAHAVVLNGSALAQPARTRLVRLQARPTPQLGWCPAAFVQSGLCATSGIELGGRSFGAPAPGLHGGDSTSSGSLSAPLATRCVPSHGCARSRTSISVALPAGSAAMIVERPQPGEKHRGTRAR